MCDMHVLSLPDVSHVFPEFPAPDLSSALLQESVTPHDVKALQLVYRRHCEVTPYLARPTPNLQLPGTTARSGSPLPCPTGPSPSTASAHSLSLAPLGTSESPTASQRTRHVTGLSPDRPFCS